MTPTPIKGTPMEGADVTTTVRPPDGITAARAALTRARAALAHRDSPANRKAVADAWAAIDQVLDQWKR